MLISISNVSWAILGSFAVFLYSFIFYCLVDPHPRFIQAFIKVGPLAGELVALVAIIDLLFLVTGAHAAILKHLALLVSASLAVF